MPGSEKEKKPTGPAAKFRPPRHPSGIVERDRLLESASEVTEYLITAVIAPGGYGKSTLLTSWRMGLISSGCQVVWVSIDEADRSTDQLVRSLCQAFQSQGISFEHFVVGAGHEAHDPASMQLAALANAVESSDRKTVLFLDDFHLLQSADALGVVQDLVARAPTNLSFVIASRQDLPDFKSFLLSKGLMRFLDVQDLAFNLDETTQFLRVFGRQDFTLAHIDLLHHATEGWVAGLHLACASLKNSRNLGESIEKFSGETSIVSNFIWNTVIQDLSEEDRDFLENLALLDTFTPRSCNFIFDRSDSADTLLRLAGQIPFMICLDEYSQTYRLHSLLREFLLARTKEKDAGVVREMHLRAFAYCRENQMIADAIDHAVAAEEHDKILDLIEQCARDVVSVGGLPLISSWIAAVPKELTENRLSLQIVLAVAYCVSRQVSGTRECLLNIERLLQQMPPGPEKDRTESEFLFVSALPHILMEGPGKGLELLEESDFLNADMDLWLKGIAANSSTLCNFFQGNIRRAHEMITVARSIQEDTQGSFRHVYTLGISGMLAAAEGKISEADTFFRKAMGTVSEDDQGRGLPFVVTAIFMVPGLYSRCRFDEIRQLMVNRTQMAMRNSIALFVTPALIAMVRMRFAMRQDERAEQILSEFQGIAVIENLNYAQAQIMQIRAEQAIIHNRLQEFERLVCEIEGLQDKEDLDPVVRKMIRDEAVILSAQQYLFLGVGDEVVDELERVVSATDLFLPVHFRLSLMIHLFLCKEKQAGLTAALPTLVDAVDFGSDLGYTQVFVDVARLFPLLLQRLQAWDFDKNGGMTRNLFVTAILEVIEQQKTGRSPKADSLAPRKSRQEVAIEVDETVTLSPRERDILVLVARGQKNREIATSLGITPETVKWHMKHIFQKLQVKNRTRAVRVAEHLKLIEF